MTAVKTLQPLAPHTEADHGPQPSQTQVLIAEDQPLSADMERAFFTGMGFGVDVVSTPREAEAAAKKKSYDLFMVDINFCKKKGINTIQMVKQSSRNQNLKIVARSVLAHPTLKKQTLHAGAHAFVVMPAPRPALIHEVKKLLDDASRVAERVNQRLEVRLQLGAAHLLGSTLDLSADGAHISLTNGRHSLLPCGTKTEIILKWSGKELHIEGEIVRHTPEGLGVRFQNIARADKKILDQYLSSVSVEQRASTYYLG